MFIVLCGDVTVTNPIKAPTITGRPTNSPGQKKQRNESSVSGLNDQKIETSLTALTLITVTQAECITGTSFKPKSYFDVRLEEGERIETHFELCD
jgi:hypothetical protein